MIEAEWRLSKVALMVRVDPHAAFRMDPMASQTAYSSGFAVTPGTHLNEAQNGIKRASRRLGLSHPWQWYTNAHTHAHLVVVVWFAEV